MTINFHNFNFRLSILLIVCILTLCGADAQVVKSITLQTNGEDATAIPYDGPVYKLLFDYDKEGRAIFAKFKDEEHDSLYVAYYTYSDKKIEIHSFQPFFHTFLNLPLFIYIKNLDDGLLKQEKREPEDSDWAIFDKHDPDLYQYDEDRRIIMWKDQWHELRFVRGADGNIAEVLPYVRSGISSNMTVEYDEGSVSDASLRLGSLMKLLGAQDYAYKPSDISNSFLCRDFMRLPMIWNGNFGRYDPNLISRMTEVSNYSYPYHTPTTHIKTLEFHYTIDDRGLIIAVDAVTTDDYYYETPVQELYGWTEAHQHRTTHFDIEWDTETSAIHQPQLAEANGSDTYYSLSGERLPAPRKGLNIIRTKDGQTRKVLVR